MVKCYYEKAGLYFVAMVRATHARRRDMTPKEIRKRETGARLFKTGWDEALASLGLIIRIDCDGYPPIFMVELEACARILGSTPKAVEKNLEVMRYLRYINRELARLPEIYGFRPTVARRHPSMENILGVEPLTSDEEEEEEAALTIPNFAYLTDSQLELPPVEDDPTEYWLF